MEAAAYSLLPEPDGTPPASFVVLHRGAERAAYLGCTWELPAVDERIAWARHMLATDPPDLDAYLADVLPEGLTGGPH